MERSATVMYPVCLIQFGKGYTLFYPFDNVERLAVFSARIVCNYQQSTKTCVLDFIVLSP